MKTFTVLVPMLSMAVMGYAGQTNQIDLKRAEPIQPPSRVNDAALVLSRTNSTQRLYRAEKTYGGVLPDLGRKKGQFFKAPASSRNGDFQNLSINQNTGRGEGI